MSGSDSMLRRLQRLRLLARAVLLFETVWPAIWPALGVAGVMLCVALLDLPRRIPAVLHAALLAGVLAACAWLLWRGLRRVRVPDNAQADRRLEQASGLRHRPLAVLSDRPMHQGPLPATADALWRAHVARATAQVGRLRAGWPHPGLAARDPRALRGALVVALVACLGIAGEEAPSRLLRAAVPHFAPAAAASATEVQGWITPPGYTDLPPVLLRPEGGGVSVPAGSHLTVSLSGGSGVPSLSLADDKLAFQPVDAGSFQADADLTQGGRLAVRRNGVELAAWDVAVVADAAPVVHWQEPPGAAKGGGRLPATRLPWQVSHEYGVTGLQAELRLAVRPDAPALLVPIPLPGAPKSAKGVKSQDLTAHPWAGIAIVGKLVAHDAPGLTGSSEEATFTLPERHFDNATARALLAVRKNLSLWPEERLTAAGDLDRIAADDKVWGHDIGGLLNLRAIIAEIAYNRDAAAVDDAQARLWQLALHLEEGATDRTARELREARQALREIMQAQQRGEHPDQKEIDKRAAALEEAIQKHLDALAEQLRQDPDAQRDAQMDNQESPREDAYKAEKLAEELRQAEREGKPEDAQQKLAELEKMLDQLQAARPQHHDAQQKQRAQKRQRGEQQMSALQDLVRREGGLLDHAQTRGAADRAGQPPEVGGAERRTDQRVQQALRRAVGELMQQYGDLTGDVPPNLGDADKAMRDAVDALGKAADQRAATDAQAAIEALQKGGQSMSEQLAQQFGNPGDQQGDEEGEQSPGMSLGNPQDGDNPNSSGGSRPWQGRQSFGRRGDQRTDPLGRPLKEGEQGNSESADVTLPEQMEQARTRAIQDELRKREGERSRPQPELDYIDRLLKQF